MEKTTLNKLPPAPSEPLLPAYQEYVRQIVDEMDWTKDPNEVFVLFTEEVGELAKEVRRSWKKPDEAKTMAAGELADVFLYLCDLANHFEVDLAQAIKAKIEKNQTRHWDF